MLDDDGVKEPEQIASELQLLSIGASEEHGLETLCITAIDTLPGEAAAVRGGNVKVLNKLVGKVMKDSRGTVDAAKIRETLERLLSGT